MGTTRNRLAGDNGECIGECPLKLTTIATFIIHKYNSFNATYLEATIASAAARTSLGNSVRNPDTIDYNRIP